MKTSNKIFIAGIMTAFAVGAGISNHREIRTISLGNSLEKIEAISNCEITSGSVTILCDDQRDVMCWSENVGSYQVYCLGNDLYFVN